MADAYQERGEHELTRLAVHASWLLNAQRKKGSKPITPRQLLGKDKPQTQLDKQQQFQKLMELRNKGVG